MAGANVNLQNFNKQTPLHFASRKDNAELCQILLENNADPNITDLDGNNGIYINLIKLLL